MGPDEFLRAANQAPILGFDTESTGLLVKDSRDKLTGVSLAFKAGPLYLSKYLPFFHETGNNLESHYLDQVQALVNVKQLSIHNAPHDIAAGLTKGLDLTKSPMIWNPMLMCHMVAEEEYSKQLDFLSKKYLGEGKYRDEITQWTNIFGWSRVPAQIMEQYAAKDAELHLRLYEYFLPRLQEEELDSLWPIEDEFQRLMAKIMIQGVRVNQAFCEQQIEIGSKRMTEIENELGFTPSKPSELHPFLLDELKLPILKTSATTGKPSFDKGVMLEYETMLEHRNNKAASLVLEYRGWQKTISSFYESLLKFISPDGRIRPNFKLHQARTTRLSCSDPALQCIPRESAKPWNGRAKEAFLAEEDFELWELDYSQLEMRLEAEYANESELRETFADPARDVFSEMAVVLSLPRFATKTFKYATGYGAGASRIAATLNIPLEQAERIRSDYRNAYPGIYSCTVRAKYLAEERGYVRYWTGRRRHLHKFDSNKAFNSLMQGGAAEVVKRVMLRVDKEVCQPSNGLVRMCLQVHDAIWLEIHKSLVSTIIPKVKQIMTDLPQFETKFAVDAHRVGAH